MELADKIAIFVTIISALFLIYVYFRVRREEYEDLKDKAEMKRIKHRLILAHFSKKERSFK